MSQSIKDVLIAARAVIEDPQKWVKGAWARTAHGQHVVAHHEQAICWCAEGAIRKANRDMGGNWDALQPAENAVVKAFGGADFDCLSTLNDNHTHAEVLAAFDKAIAECGI